MGTQQVFMVILTVIVVGAAVAVGIQMFNTQLNNQARNAVISDIMYMGALAQAWYRTPAIMGGGGGQPEIPNASLRAIALYIDDTADDTDGYIIENANGTYQFALDGLMLTITGTSKLSKNLVISRGVIDLDGGHDGISINPVLQLSP